MSSEKGIKGIVIPPPRKGRSPKHPWDKLLKVGKIVIPNRKVHSVSSTIYAAAKRLGKRFSIRTEGPDVAVYVVAEGKK